MTGKTLNLSIDLVNWRLINPEYLGPRVPILYEDETFLVFDKPSNIHCHGLRYSDNRHILSFLRQYHGRDLLKVDADRHERGLLHRLDFETSGVLIYVKNQKDHQTLRENFHSMVRKKIYFARLSLSNSLSGVYRAYFKNHPKDPKKVLVGAEEGQLGEINCTPDRHGNLQVELSGGFRHQIRSHLAYLGNPILGDELYGGKKYNQLCLHCHRYEIEFKHRVYTFISDREKSEIFK